MLCICQSDRSCGHRKALVSAPRNKSGLFHFAWNETIAWTLSLSSANQNRANVDLAYQPITRIKPAESRSCTKDSGLSHPPRLSQCWNGVSREITKSWSPNAAKQTVPSVILKAFFPREHMWDLICCLTARCCCGFVAVHVHPAFSFVQTAGKTKFTSMPLNSPTSASLKTIRFTTQLGKFLSKCFKFIVRENPWRNNHGRHHKRKGFKFPQVLLDQGELLSGHNFLKLRKSWDCSGATR